MQLANELTQSRARFGDSLQNLTANLAIGNAKTVSDAFGLNTISSTELHAMYRGDWMSRKIVDVPIKEAIRPWRMWQTDAADIEKMLDVEKAHQIKAKVSRGFRWARLHGGAAILISNGDDDTSKPMTAVGKGRLQCFTLLQRDEITPHGIVQDPRSPEFRNPEYYQLTTGDGNAMPVHHSRVIRLIGAERPDVAFNEEGWGDSILQIVYDAIHHAALTTTAIAELVHEAKIDVIGVHDLTKHLSSTAGTELITKRFTAANMIKSINNTLLLDIKDKWDRKQTSFAGLPDVLQLYLQIVAGAAEMPATKFLGISPGGLNSTGSGEENVYHETLDGWRTDELEPVLAKIDRVLWMDATGADKVDAKYVFGDIKKASEKDQAEIADRKADTTKKYFDMGLFEDEELREVVIQQLEEDAVYPGLSEAVHALRAGEDDPGGDKKETAKRVSEPDRSDDSGVPRYRESA